MLEVCYEDQRHECANLREASEMFREFIEGLGLGSSDLTSRDGLVYSGRRLVARISYNGRAWAVAHTRDWDLSKELSLDTDPATL